MCVCLTSDDKITCANSAKTLATYNRRQNKLRHWLQKGKYSFSSLIPSMQCCAAVRATYRKQQTPQIWMEGEGVGVDSFVLWRYPIWVQCLNNFVADYSIAWVKRQSRFFIPIFLLRFVIYINILFSRFSRPTTIETASLHMRWDRAFTPASWKSNLTRGLGTSPWGLSSMDREQVRKSHSKKRLVDQVSS